MKRTFSRSATFAVLYGLYWDDGMSLWKIARRYGCRSHQAVRFRMLTLGIPRRAVGRATVAACIIEGCAEPTYKIQHAANGSRYGRRCLAHWVAHRHRLAAEYWRDIAKWRRGHDLAAVIGRFVRPGMPPEIRDDVIQSLALDLLTRKIRMPELKEAAAERSRFYNNEYFNKYRTCSIDSPIGNSDLMLVDTLAAPEPDEPQWESLVEGAV